MGTIVATLEDYSHDFRSHLVPEYFRKLMNEMHQRFLIYYCRNLFAKGAKISRKVRGVLWMLWRGRVAAAGADAYRAELFLLELALCFISPIVRAQRDGLCVDSVHV